MLFLSGMLPVVNGTPKYVGRLGKDIDVDSGRDALRAARLNALAPLRDHLGSLDKVARVLRLGIYLAPPGSPSISHGLPTRPRNSSPVSSASLPRGW
jgi:hypothetical protein